MMLYTFRWMWHILLLFLLLLLLVAEPIYAQSSNNYKIKKDVANQGGAASQSTNYKIVEAIGQPSPLGTAISSNYKDASGFFANAGTSLVPILVVSPTTLNFGTMFTSMTFQISNGGSGTLTWTITESPDKPWLTSFTPASGTGNATVSVTVDRSLLTSNSDTGTLLVSSNGGNQTVIVLISKIPGGVPITPVATSPQTAGAEFWVDVVVGSNSEPVTNLFGISFDVNFTNTTYIDVVTPYSSNVIVGDFLGSDLVFFPNVDETAGKVSIGISRKSGADGVNGFGTVAKIKFKADASTPNNTPVQFSISNVSANDPGGTNIPLVPGTITVNITSGIIVWPGDTNNDGIVNQADILPLGLHWGRTGPPRICHPPSQEMMWMAHTATPWTPLNATYADANGDGTVNQTDVLPIGLNWGKTHTGFFAGQSMSSSFNSITLDSAIITLKCSGSTSPGQHFYIDIFAKKIKDLFGLSFELFYSPTTFIDSLKVEEGAGNILGNDLIFFPVVIVGSDTGKVSVGISRKFGQGGVTADSGLVARINVKMRGTAQVNKDSTLLWFKKIVANDPIGNIVAIKSEKLSWKHVIGTAQPTKVRNQIEVQPPAEFFLSQNHPNPFNPTTTISYAVAKNSHVKITVYNTLGQLVAVLVNGNQAPGTYSVTWDAGNQPSGLYLCHFEADGFTATKKMFLQK